MLFDVVSEQLQAYSWRICLDTCEIESPSNLWVVKLSWVENAYSCPVLSAGDLDQPLKEFWNYFLKLFQRLWTCRKTFVSWNNFEIISWHVTTALATSRYLHVVQSHHVICFNCSLISSSLFQSVSVLSTCLPLKCCPILHRNKRTLSGQCLQSCLDCFSDAGTEVDIR